MQQTPKQYTLSDLRKATGHNSIYATKAGYVFVAENGTKWEIRSQNGVIFLGNPTSLKRLPKD